MLLCLSSQLTAVNSTVGLIGATDVDSEPLYYRLESATVRTQRCYSDTGLNSVEVKTEQSRNFVRLFVCLKETMLINKY